jgi:hypothetical protein
MHTASTAEWILCRLTTKERAASMVGDLVEIAKQKGKLWFWFSVAGVALSLFWRRPIAFFAAFYVGSWTLNLFMMAAISIYSQHLPPASWMNMFNALVLVGSTECALSIYAAIRYGLQERITQMALIWTGLVTTVIYFWWQPVVLGVCIAVSVFIATVSMLTDKRRMELLVVFLAVLIASATRWLAMLPAAYYQYYLGRHLHIYWGSREVQEHPSVIWAAFCMMILGTWMATTAWSRMHNWLMRKQMLESRGEML